MVESPSDPLSLTIENIIGKYTSKSSSNLQSMSKSNYLSFRNPLIEGLAFFRNEDTDPLFQEESGLFAEDAGGFLGGSLDSFLFEQKPVVSNRTKSSKPSWLESSSDEEKSLFQELSTPSFNAVDILGEKSESISFDLFAEQQLPEENIQNDEYIIIPRKLPSLIEAEKSFRFILYPKLRTSLVLRNSLETLFERIKTVGKESGESVKIKKWTLRAQRLVKYLEVTEFPDVSAIGVLDGVISISQPQENRTIPKLSLPEFKPKSFKKREKKKALTNLLIDSVGKPPEADDDFAFFSLDLEKQFTFNEILSDSESDEGSRLLKLLDIVKTSASEVVPQDLSLFIDSMAVHLAKFLGLSSKGPGNRWYEDTIYIFLERFLYPLLWSSLAQIVPKSNLIINLGSTSYIDKELEGMGFFEIFKSRRAAREIFNNEISLLRSIEQLRDGCTPIDVMEVLRRAISGASAIGHRTVCGIRGKEVEQLGADDLLPILMFLVSEVENVTNWGWWIAFMEELETARVLRSSLGYSLTLLKTVVTAI